MGEPQYSKVQDKPLICPIAEGGEPALTCWCTVRCQWAVDFKFYCVGGCNHDTAPTWEEGFVPRSSWSNNRGAWAAPANPGDPDITYTVGTYKYIETSGVYVLWLCIEQHDVSYGDTFDAGEEAKWTKTSVWLQDGDPYCIQYARGVVGKKPGLYYDAGDLCAATRYGPIHQKETCTAGVCSVHTSPDVSTALPTDYDHEDLCGPGTSTSPTATPFTCNICATPRHCSLSVTISGITTSGYTCYNNEGGWTLSWKCHTSTPTWYCEGDHTAVVKWSFIDHTASPPVALDIYWYGGKWQCFLWPPGWEGGANPPAAFDDISDDDCDQAGDDTGLHVPYVGTVQPGTITVTPL
jgi:hypothetical protein